jgi:GPH family glycoside/pentoside/hexuronide:cation symporter
VAFFGVATIGFTFVGIPYGAMAGEMTQDPQERSNMTAFRMTFASIGLLLAGAVMPALAGDTRDGYLRAVMLVAPIVVISIWGMLWATRRAPRIDAASTVGFKAIAGLVLGNRAFVVLVVIYGVLTLAVALLGAGLQLATLYLMHDRGDAALSGLAAAIGLFSALFAMFILGAILSQYAWVKCSVALGKRRALMVSIVVYIAVLSAVWLSLPSENITVLAVLFLLAGGANGGYQQIPWAMYPDLMDTTRNSSGQAIEGAFSAVWLFGQKIANALAPLCLGLILWQAGWQESATGVVAQSPQALEALKAALTLVPIAIFGVSLGALAWVYGRLDRAGGLHDAG